MKSIQELKDFFERNNIKMGEPSGKNGRLNKLDYHALTISDKASRFKEAEPLTSKNSDAVRNAFEKIYKRSPLTRPKSRSWKIIFGERKRFNENDTPGELQIQYGLLKLL